MVIEGDDEVVVFRVYSFGHLKSAKSFENGRLWRGKSYQKNVNSENGRVGRLCRKNAKRMDILKEREFECCCLAEGIEANCIDILGVPEKRQQI